MEPQLPDPTQIPPQQANNMQSVPETSPGPQLPPESVQQQPAVSQNKSSMTPILLLVLLVVAAAVGGWWYWQQSPKMNSIAEKVATPSPTQTPTPESSAVPSATPETMERTSKISYTLPAGWTEETMPINENDRIQKKGFKHQFTNMMGEETEETFYLVDVKGPPGGGQLTIFSKGEYYIALIESHELSGSCGMINVFKDDNNPEFYKPLTILEQKALRPYLERGQFFVMPEYYGEPRPQYIFGVHEKSVNGDTYTEQPFCIDEPASNTRLTIEYVSPNFKGENFDPQAGTAKNIDTTALAEMDSILESITVN